VSAEVKFRLEIHTGGHPRITGMLLAFDGSRVPPSTDIPATLSSTPANIQPAYAARSEQHGPTKANLSLASRHPPNPINPDELAKRSNLPEVSFDTDQAPTSLPVSSIPAQAPEFVPRQTLRDSSKEAMHAPTHEPAKEGSFGAATSPIYVPPRPIKQVMPNTKFFGSSLVDAPTQIDIEVKIDQHGKVVEATALRIPANVHGSPLVARAIAAAKQWIFEPARMHGQNIPADHIIRFQFRSQGR